MKQLRNDMKLQGNGNPGVREYTHRSSVMTDFRKYCESISETRVTGKSLLSAEIEIP